MTTKRRAYRTPEVMDIVVTRDMLSDFLHEGDIITMGTKEAPARDWRTGLPVPPTQKFRVVVRD